jgi:hypothetical protein
MDVVDQSVHACTYSEWEIFMLSPDGAYRSWSNEVAGALNGASRLSFRTAGDRETLRSSAMAVSVSVSFGSALRPLGRCGRRSIR